MKSPEFRGATDHAYTIALKNETGTQQLGSANITIPDDLTILPLPAPGTGPNIALDSATVARGGTWTLTSGPPRTLRAAQPLDTSPA